MKDYNGEEWILKVPTTQMKDALVKEIAEFLNANSDLLEDLARKDLKKMTIGTLVHLHMALADYERLQQ